MTKAHLLLVSLITVLGMVEGGCAAHPLLGARRDSADSLRASSWACYGVSWELFKMATDLGYSPEIRDGNTVFCRERIGSDTSKEHCVDAAALSFEVLRQQ